MYHPYTDKGLDLLKAHKKVSWAYRGGPCGYITIILADDYVFRGGLQKITVEDYRQAMAWVKAARKYRPDKKGRKQENKHDSR